MAALGTDVATIDRAPRRAPRPERALIVREGGVGPSVPAALAVLLGDLLGAQTGQVGQRAAVL